MITIVSEINSDAYSSLADIDIAASIIRNGGLVAFPTETVYGLGADALSPEAVKKIYTAKGRPSDNPLIVHISDIKQLEAIAETNNRAMALAHVFWPGPLTIIMAKKDLIPLETSSGLNTIAVRMPQNKIARLLIERAGRPIAAPSANASGRPSPTSASHVYRDMSGKIDMILDGGLSEFGLESTIIDVSVKTPCILRPGSITKEMVEQVIGGVDSFEDVNIETPKAPGMKYKHYSPDALMHIVTAHSLRAVADKIFELASKLPYKKSEIGVLVTEQSVEFYKGSDFSFIVAGDRNHPKTIAAALFACLHEFNRLGVKIIFSESFEEIGVGVAIMNRLKKAAGCNIINAD